MWSSLFGMIIEQYETKKSILNKTNILTQFWYQKILIDVVYITVALK